MKMRIILMLFGVMLITTACGKDSKDAMDEGMTTDQEMITGGIEAGVVDGSMGTGLGTQEELAIQAGDTVYFGYDQYNLTDEARNTLTLQSEWLNQYPNVSIVVEGHADERGTREYNLALGERRANSVKNYLIASGIDPMRIRVISYGKERPAVAGSTPSAWAQNRRAATVIE